MRREGDLTEHNPAAKLAAVPHGRADRPATSQRIASSTSIPIQRPVTFRATGHSWNSNLRKIQSQSASRPSWMIAVNRITWRILRDQSRAVS
jgi:hypothetical protein